MIYLTVRYLFLPVNGSERKHIYCQHKRSLVRKFGKTNRRYASIRKYHTYRTLLRRKLTFEPLHEKQLVFFGIFWHQSVIFWISSFSVCIAVVRVKQILKMKKTKLFNFYENGLISKIYSYLATNCCHQFCFLY